MMIIIINKPKILERIKKIINLFFLDNNRRKKMVAFFPYQLVEVIETSFL